MENKLMNKKCRFIISILLFSLAILLYLNRFGLTYKFWIDNVWIDFYLRHFLEHLIFGLLVPIFVVIAWKIFGLKKYFLWKYSYFFGVFIVLVIQLQRINATELIRSIFDLAGLILAYLYLKNWNTLL